MADYIETIPQEMFNMRLYRTGEKVNRECGSVGCVIGHCTILDENPLPLYRSGNVNFYEWSEHFTGSDPLSDESTYLFSGLWDGVDNTPTGAAKRIRHFLLRGLPQNWYEQMKGIEPLSYQNQTK